MKAIWVSSLLIWSLLFTARASANDITTAVVLDPVQTDLWQRLQGQLSDTPLRILREHAAEGSPLERAFVAARRHSASIVVWFVEQRAWQVSVLDVGRSRLVERTIGPGESNEVMARSARTEAAAFVVRAAIEEILEGREIGRPVVSPATARPAARSAIRPPVRSASSARPHFGLSLLSGYHGVADGIAVRHGPLFGARFDSRQLFAETYAFVSTGSRFDSRGFSLDIWHYDLRAKLGTYLCCKVPFGVTAALVIGPGLYRRVTRVVPAGYVSEEASAQASLFLGAALGGDVRLSAAGARLRLALTAEMPTAQRELVVTDGSFALATAWPVQVGVQASLLLPL